MVPLVANENAAPELNVRLNFKIFPMTFTGASVKK